MIDKRCIFCYNIDMTPDIPQSPLPEEPPVAESSSERVVPEFPDEAARQQWVKVEGLRNEIGGLVAEKEMLLDELHRDPNAPDRAFKEEKVAEIERALLEARADYAQARFSPPSQT